MRQIRYERIEAMKKMTPAQRLQTFVAHSYLMIKLYEAGIRFRKLKQKTPPSQ